MQTSPLRWRYFLWKKGRNQACNPLESISNHHRVIVAGSLLTFLCDLKIFFKSESQICILSEKKLDSFNNCHCLTHFLLLTFIMFHPFWLQAIPPTPPRRFMAPVPTIEVVPKHWGHVRKFCRPVDVYRVAFLHL